MEGILYRFFFLLACLLAYGRASAQITLPTDTIFFTMWGESYQDSISIYVNNAQVNSCYVGLHDAPSRQVSNMGWALVRKMPLPVPMADSVDIRVDFYENLHRYWFWLYDLRRCNISQEAIKPRYADSPTQSIILRAPLSKDCFRSLVLFPNKNKTGFSYEYFQQKKARK